MGVEQRLRPACRVLEPGDIVGHPSYPGQRFRVWQIVDGQGCFYRVTRRGRRDRRSACSLTGPLTGWELLRKCEFPQYDACVRCGGKSAILINGRCPRCNPFRACPIEGCGGDLVSQPLPNWMNRWVCNQCGTEVSR